MSLPHLIWNYIDNFLGPRDYLSSQKRLENTDTV